MKRNIFIISATILTLILSFSGCSELIMPEEITTTTPPTESVTAEKPTDNANPYISGTDRASEPATEETTSEKKTTVSETTEHKKTASQTTTAYEKTTATPSAPQIIGLSSTGFDIVEQDGMTYVGGVLIANKTYSLPSTYNPGTLTSECKAAFKAMEKDAEAQGLDIYISSGFRSYSLQESLYSRYCSKDGKAAADRYSARAGHSEHQTGLAIDLNTIKYSFADTAEGKWVAENCWKYGFILRYPENKEDITGYRYEPWHIRYVGVDMASKVYASGLCLEEYLGITSQYD